jgi:hypothetical protein
MRRHFRIVQDQVNGGISPMISTRSIALAAMTVLALGTAQAAYIVDTGPGSSPLWSLDDGFVNQHLGVTFNVGTASTINSIEGWIGLSTTSPASGNVLVELIDGGSPNGSVLYSATFGPTFVGLGLAAWQGEFGLNWLVAAGDYTLVFIGENGLKGFMPGGAPNALATEWFRNDSTNNGDWTLAQGFDDFNLGIRIDATASAVPEPGTLALLGLGLIGLAAARRRKH